jgi:hypothetical protein
MDVLATLASDIKADTTILPRPLLENLEKVAIALHELYNQKQYERHPERTNPYPRFSDLPDTLKYSNLRQARSIAKMLDLMGWEMRPQGSAGEVVTEISNDIVETLALFEHSEWVRERVDSGWVYGDVKDVENKISPYLVPYRELPEEVKDLDRDVVRNIPELLAMIGMGIYVRNSE